MKENMYLSYSSYTTLTFCPRFFQIRYLLGMKEPSNSSLSLGQIFHRQAYFLLEKTFEGTEPTQADLIGSENGDFEYDIADIVIKLFKPKVYKLLKELKIDSFLGETEFKDTEQKIIGIPDAVLHTKDGNVVVFEYKTTRSYKEYIINNIYSSPQLILYNYLIHKVMHFKKPITFVVWIINLKNLRIDVEVIKLASHPPEEKRLLESIYSWRGMLNIFKSTGNFPQSLSKCGNFFGGDCPYFNYRNITPLDIALNIEGK